LKIANNVALLIIGERDKVHPVLTWDKNNLVLIDAGYPGQTSAIIEAISDEGFCAENLTHIIVTHQDYDHIGCIMDLQRLAPNIKVLSHDDEAPYIDGRKMPIKLKTRLEKYDTFTPERRASLDWQKEYYESTRITITETVSCGMVLSICGGIEVIHTPGHVPGHIALLLKESNILVCGDGLTIKEGHLVALSPASNYDHEQAISSFDKIRLYNLNGIVAYHGGFLKLKN